MRCRNEAAGCEVAGGAVELTIPRVGEVRWQISGPGGLNMVRGAGDDGTGGGRMVLVVGTGEDTDELVVAEHREFRVDPDGTVRLTLNEYVQVSAGLPMLGSAVEGLVLNTEAIEKRLDALESRLGVTSDPAQEGSEGPPLCGDAASEPEKEAF